MSLNIRQASRSEFATAIKWAGSEGWNPGIDDLDAFYAFDPSGFLMGWIDDKPVSSISVVRYGEDFGFLGFYIVDPAHRGSGIGLKTWNAGMAYLEGRSVGLDGVVEQQENYRKSGFRFVGRNVRFSGKILTTFVAKSSLSIRPIRLDDLNAIFCMDRLCFGKNRDAFISDWCFMLGSETRQTLVCYIKDKLVGFGTIRQCLNGYKVAPLFCDNSDIAQQLFCALVAKISPDSTISIDVPSLNSAAAKLAEDVGLLPSFETARMVRGTAPPVDWNRVFGLTSFELG